jgi:hypothetical protein
MPAMPHRRRTVPLDERMTPCGSCGYFPSEHRHALRFAAGEASVGGRVPLCPNCHALYAIIEGAGRGNAADGDLLDALRRAAPPARAVAFLSDLYERTSEVEPRLRALSAAIQNDPGRVRRMRAAGKSDAEIAAAFGFDGPPVPDATR